MLVIRLQRTGRQNLATYRVVVAEKSKAVKKQAVEIVGHYLPTRKPKVIEIDQAKVSAWIAKGAQPSATVASLLKNLGMPNMEKYIGRPNKKRKATKAPAEVAPEAPAAPAEEATPVES